MEAWLARLSRDVGASQSVRYRDVATGLRAAIARGELPVGTRLPPERELARLLSVGRTTVVTAYNLLRAESLIVTKESGSWVARRPLSAPPPARP
jgi:DNA-binding GntR family transcriptional regulator